MRKPDADRFYSCYAGPMRRQPLLWSALLLALAANVWLVWRGNSRWTEVAFLGKRLTFLEEENRRLTGLLARNAQSQETALEAAQRIAVEKAVVNLRGLPFLKPVAYRTIPRSELPSVLRQKLAQQVPDREFRSEEVALGALGLLPSSIDLKKTYLDLLGEQIGAFYDQHSRELYTFSNQSLSNSQSRVILAHELTHALEDQHFHLENLPLEAEGNDDRALAASALVEGDATLVMDRYMIGDLSTSALKDSLASALTTDVRQLVAAPRFLRETLVFPYLKGQDFCQALYTHGGWKALADAFRHPPSSSSQILHPERFLALPRQEPLEIEYEDRTIKGQQPASDNVAGEFGLRQLLANWLKDDVKAAELAANWVGDRYLVYGDEKTSSYIWRCAWASENAARQFVAAAQTGWQVRYGIAPTGAYPTADPGSVLTKTATWACRLPDGRELRISQDHQFVTLEVAENHGWLIGLQQIALKSSPNSL